jgi:hypothetical protein
VPGVGRNDDAVARGVGNIGRREDAGVVIDVDQALPAFLFASRVSNFVTKP